MSDIMCESPVLVFIAIEGQSEVVEVMATLVEVNERELVVWRGDEEVARYPRKSVAWWLQNREPVPNAS